jgi:hypothetical protein
VQASPGIQAATPQPLGGSITPGQNTVFQMVPTPFNPSFQYDLQIKQFPQLGSAGVAQYSPFQIYSTINLPQNLTAKKWTCACLWWESGGGNTRLAAGNWPTVTFFYKGSVMMQFQVPSFGMFNPATATEEISNPALDTGPSYQLGPNIGNNGIYIPLTNTPPDYEAFQFEFWAPNPAYAITVADTGNPSKIFSKYINVICPCDQIQIGWSGVFLNPGALFPSPPADGVPFILAQAVISM